jgi:hypothetical protein
MTDIKRRLPRFEAVKIGTHWVAYDFLTKQARFAPDPKNFLATQGLVEVMAAEARTRGEVLSLERVDHPSAAPRSSKTAKPQQH